MKSIYTLNIVCITCENCGHVYEYKFDSSYNDKEVIYELIMKHDWTLDKDQNKNEYLYCPDCKPVD